MSGNANDLEIDTVNPYDPPERQTLEQKLQNDTHLQHQTHDTIQQEQRLADSAQASGYGHHQADERIHSLQSTEQQLGGVVVQDHQNIDQWDHDHQGWDQPGSADSDGASDSSAADPSSSYDSSSSDASDSSSSSDAGDNSSSSDGDDG